MRSSFKTSANCFRQVPSPGKEIWQLRPHHGICLFFFVGKGYSGTFTQNMKNKKALLENGARIQLFSKPDIICRSCPNLQGEGGICESEEKVLRYDRAVLANLHLTEKGAS